MPKLVVHGATLTCNMGSSSCQFTVQNRDLDDGGQPAATVEQNTTDEVPGFGMCACPSNPAVVAATALAAGVPTPAPCAPSLSDPWQPGSANCSDGGIALLTDADELACQYGGVISVEEPNSEIELD
ncbi:MAG: DUF4280 domain-containing protein [Myxococcota bacterium]